MWRASALFVVLISTLGAWSSVSADDAGQWLDEIVGPRSGTAPPATPQLKLVRQDFEKLEFGRSVIKTPLTIGSKHYDRGLGTHSVSHLSILSREPITRLQASVGVDRNDRTASGVGSISFSVLAGGKELQRTKVMRGGDEPQEVDLAIDGATELDLRVSDAGDGPACDHADWADARITLKDGRQFWLDELPLAGATIDDPRYPFAFTYQGKPAGDLLEGWKREDSGEQQKTDRIVRTVKWTDPASGLGVTWEMVRYPDHAAADWLLYFENTGTAETGIIEDVLPLSAVVRNPMRGRHAYQLYHTKGGPANPADFEASTMPIETGKPLQFNPGHGRSSSACFPFFKVEAGRGSAIVAIGWSGTWKAEFAAPDGRQLRMTAGLEKTHFKLKPGEKVRSPRIVLLTSCGDTWEANAGFRALVSEHYAARRAGKVPLPMLFCNTCFTRGGGWLNECNAENQISLINAYAPLGLEAILTDAGWFEGGWPAGAGNWNPRKDAYPQGMGPVAAAAKAKGMVYGLWYEPERVVTGTWLHKNKPEWLLHSKAGDEGTYLLNFGLPEVQRYFFEIVKGFMDLPGFRFYRQDFNMDPLPYWRFTDAADRQGVTEMKYIEGLYAYWDAIAHTWPDSVREECASGGNRIDLETVMRMHLHQKTDYWFDNETDQASLWGLSQYLPNNVVVAHLNRMDDYSFHSTLASSLCMGWIADAPDFDFARGKKLLDQYLAVRHLLTGAWYPLLPYSRDLNDWTGSQWHRADLDEGLLLVFRRANSPYRTVDAPLRGLNPSTTYEYECFSPEGQRVQLRATGTELMKQIRITLPERHSSDLIVYRMASEKR